MLSTRTIVRHWRERRFAALLDSLAGNGVPIPRNLRARLIHQADAVAGLALARMLDLSYGVDAAAIEMVRALREGQTDEGVWSDDPLATAAALHGLHRYLDALGPNRVDVETSQAVERARMALVSRCVGAEVFLREPEVAAWIVCLLRQDADFMQACEAAGLTDSLTQRLGALSPAGRSMAMLAFRRSQPAASLAA